MPLRFFYALRAGGLKPSVQEYLALLAALKAEVIAPDLNEFHALARLSLVKDEAQFDRFDRIFAAYLEGTDRAFTDLDAVLPPDWLRAEGKRVLSEEEKAAIAALGDFDALMAALRERLAQQRERHAGGNRWIGTGGSSPFGNSGFNPEGVRVGGPGGEGKAVKVWEQRGYRDLDDDEKIGPRNMKIALRRLRRFAREGAELELDLEHTIDSTARNAGWLDLKLRPERHNAVKVLLLLDVGGSMDPHVRLCEALFSAVRSEFKHLEHYYFHNFVYERLWKENARRKQTEIATNELLHRYERNWRVIFVGDASMSPYEILSPGGSIEYWNQEPGLLWLQRILQAFPKTVWLNPTEQQHWHYTPSLQITREALQGRMFPLTLNGLNAAIDALQRSAT